jgi:enterochelin esterase family protein
LTSSHGKYHATIQVMTADDYAYQVASQRIASPSILAVWRDASLHHAAAVDKFWAGLSGKSPIVEPYPNHPDESLVTFVFRSKQPYVGAFITTEDQEEPLVKIGDSNLWYVSVRVPTDSRFDYGFIVADGPPDLTEKPGNPDKRFLAMQRDPNNPLIHGDKSRVELPGAPPQRWIGQHPDAPKGKLEDIAIDSTRLKEKRKVLVYLPPAYDPTKHYPLLIAFDGEKYGMEPRNTEIPLPTILDNLIAAHEIPPVVAALVASESLDKRLHDLACSDPFSHFVVDELIPKMRADFHAGLKPADVTLTGSSLGGLMSSFIAFHHPDVIGNVLSQSGSYWWFPGWPERDLPSTTEGNQLAREIAATSKKSINFYLEAGIFEHSILHTNRHLRDVLVAKGYRVTYREFHGGHDYLMWRGSISDGLIALLARH